MPYLWSEGLLVVGLLLLVPPVLAARRAAGRLRAARTATSEDLKERTGLIKARVAGIKVAVAQRLHRATE